MRQGGHGMSDLKREESASSPSRDNVLSPEELWDLRRHHNFIIGLFVAFWVCAILVIGAIQFLDLSEAMARNSIGVLFAGAIVMLALQYSKRCPRCRANLGRQARMGIPENCKKCGVRLSDKKKPA